MTGPRRGRTARPHTAASRRRRDLRPARGPSGVLLPGLRQQPHPAHRYAARGGRRPRGGRLCAGHRAAGGLCRHRGAGLRQCGLGDPQRQSRRLADPVRDRRAAAARGRNQSPAGRLRPDRDDHAGRQMGAPGHQSRADPRAGRSSRARGDHRPAGRGGAGAAGRRAAHAGRSARPQIVIPYYENIPRRRTPAEADG
jgi:hypothetical protein